MPGKLTVGVVADFVRQGKYVVVSSFVAATSSRTTSSNPHLLRNLSRIICSLCINYPLKGMEEIAHILLRSK